MQIRVTDPSVQSFLLHDLDKQTRYITYNHTYDFIDTDYILWSLQQGSLHYLLSLGHIVITKWLSMRMPQYHTFTATAGQTVITMPSPYVAGEKTLTMYINGTRQLKDGTVYTETNNNTITMLAGLLVTDIVELEWTY